MVSITVDLSSQTSEMSVPEHERRKGEGGEGLRALGSGSTKYQYDHPEPTLLEHFPNPQKDWKEIHEDFSIEITAPEFTSLCPITGQPDYATIIVRYQPRERCVESKSWKLYLNSYRNHGEFHESCVCRMMKDLVDLLDPEWLEVVGQFAPRGGIKFWPTMTYSRLLKDQFEELRTASGKRDIFGGGGVDDTK